MNTTQATCDKCDSPNPIAHWSNYCPQCREAYHIGIAKDRDRESKATELFWRNKPE